MKARIPLFFFVLLAGFSSCTSGPAAEIDRDRPTSDPISDASLNPWKGDFRTPAEVGLEAEEVYFRNESSQPVDIVRIDAKGNQHSYGTLERGWFKPYQTQADTLWLVTTKQGEALGYFLTEDKIADATIPK